MRDDGRHFRDRFGDSRLVLMAQKPDVLYAYWEVDWRRQGLVAQHLKCDWSTLPMFLTVHDITDVDFDGSNSCIARTIRLNTESDSWYVAGLDSNRDYCVELGTTALDGHFFPILRSNICRTPAGSFR